MANSMEARPAFLDHPLAEFAVTLPPNLRLRGRQDKFILRETMRQVLPRRLYERQKFAFMAPPSHTDAQKLKAMRSLADTYLSERAIAEAGLLSVKGVQSVLERHENPHTPVAERVQLDAVINHLISVQIMHHHFVSTCIPRVAADRARTLGWKADSLLVS
jgi:asparagine synthase (glutamine-hydrolysing)